MKARKIFGIFGMLMLVLLIQTSIQTSAVVPPTKAIMISLEHGVVQPDGTIQVDITGVVGSGNVSDFIGATVTIDPSSDTPQTISTKITDAIIQNALDRGFTLVKTDVIIFSFQKGS